MKLGVCLLLLLISFSAGWAQQEEEIVKLFDKAIDDFQTGKSDQTIEGLKKIVDLGVSPELAFSLREKSRLSYFYGNADRRWRFTRCYPCFFSTF
jgi:hypothetical protein